MLSLLKPKPVIDDASVAWLLDCFQWAIEHFDRKALQQCKLVLPSNEFFPDRVNSVHGMAQAIFSRVIGYAGLSHWPFTLVSPENFIAAPVPQLSLDSSQRNNSETGTESAPMRLIVSYQPQQTKQPQAMAAAFGHLVAQHLVYQSGQTPPGGSDYVAQATEVVAIFMGFGLLLTNSAYQFRTGCGSCYDPAANRSAVLSERESLVGLAIFCHVKGIDNRHLFQHLKSHLKGTYKRAQKQLQTHSNQLTQLQQLVSGD
ncbi:hypothetical protein QSV34_13880 [Porticoccus sp. W117]|uniref:hypothetical protein n=1 Tax=Porticoccus sp. W117 TaxID=3054777 RepID=UPI0025943013|nr:hypothetical protein [Porticoccus sp. W117]MDM3872437.1 hypothetical protein [Porticoccus sp. W117]